MRVRATEILLYMGDTSEGKGMNYQSGHLYVFRKTDFPVPQIIIPPPKTVFVGVGGGEEGGYCFQSCQQGSYIS